MAKTTFIGHRRIYYESEQIKQRLIAAIYDRINGGCRSFIVGSHGEFDEMALAALRAARKKGDDITIEVAVTSISKINKKKGSDFVPYEDVKTVMFDVETEFYKRRIIASNRFMIDECDTIICCVDERNYASGAKTALNYAKKKGLTIINLFREDDCPTYKMTSAQKDAYIKNELEELTKTLESLNANKK